MVYVVAALYDVMGDVKTTPLPSRMTVPSGKSAGTASASVVVVSVVDVTVVTVEEVEVTVVTVTVVVV